MYHAKAAHSRYALELSANKAFNETELKRKIELYILLINNNIFIINIDLSLWLVSLIQMNIANKNTILFHTSNPFKTIFTINSQYRNSLQVIFEIPSKL